MWQAEPLSDLSGVEYKTWTKNGVGEQGVT